MLYESEEGAINLQDSFAPPRSPLMCLSERLQLLIVALLLLLLHVIVVLKADGLLYLHAIALLGMIHNYRKAHGCLDPKYFRIHAKHVHTISEPKVTAAAERIDERTPGTATVI